MSRHVNTRKYVRFDTELFGCAAIIGPHVSLPPSSGWENQSMQSPLGRISLLKIVEMCVQVMNAFREVQKEVPRGEEFEHSEMLFYEALIIEEAGKPQESLDFIEQVKEELQDPLGLKETKARLYLALGQRGDAESTYRLLLF